MSLTNDGFRALLGRFATGVCVLTCRDASGTPQGMTVSALSSVSLEPPMLLVCVGKQAPMVPALIRARFFGVSILASDQRAVSEHFAATTAVGSIPHTVTESGVALLAGACAGIECARRDVVDGGDHFVVFGTVLDGRPSERSPLVHYRGRYGALGDER